MAEAISKLSPLDSHSVLNFSQARLPRQFSNAMTRAISVTKARKRKSSARKARQLKMRLTRLIGRLSTVRKRQSAGALHDVAASQWAFCYSRQRRGVRCSRTAYFWKAQSYHRLQPTPIASRAIGSRKLL